MKKILLIATGGTIASCRSESGLSPTIMSEEILNFVPEVRAFCDVDTYQLFNLDSTNLTPDHWLSVANTIYENYESYDGFVICHGTDTMSYTACALSYLIQNSNKPIVITGSQKPINVEDTDAKINLRDSFLYATSAKAGNVCIVFNGKVIAGTRAKKVRTKSYNAFESMDYPYLARILDGKIAQYISQPSFDMVKFYKALNTKVGLINLTPGMDCTLLEDYFLKNDVVIISSYGSGGLPIGENFLFFDIIKKYTQKGKILAMATQVQNEGSDMTIYRVGAEVKKEFNVIEAFDMTLEAVITKLMWATAQKSDFLDVRELFYKPINFDILNV